MIQPLLLMKQTLDAQYDPGPLLLGGPNVQFTTVEQVLSPSRGEFFVGFENTASTIAYVFKGLSGKGFEISEVRSKFVEGVEAVIRPNMTHREIINSSLRNKLLSILKTKPWP